MGDCSPAGRGRPRACYAGGPGSGECAFILNDEFELEVLAPILGIEVKWLHTRGEPEILLRIPFQGFLRDFVINQPIAFHHMQSPGVRRAVHDHHSRMGDRL